MSLRERLLKLCKWNKQYGVGCGEMENARLLPIITILIDVVEMQREALSKYKHFSGDCGSARTALAKTDEMLKGLEGK